MTIADRCRALLAGLYNDESDATLVFRGCSYAEVMAAALCDPDVRAVVAMLPADWRGGRAA